MLRDHTVWFLAIDFDKACWADDARALLETCRAKGVPAALERSRSGNGGHVWIFFAEPVSARIARQLGSSLITLTMDQRPEIGFASYDRLFPSQDTLPLGGFGNLIALPLQREARRKGNSVFVDMDLHPYADQWAYLSALPRLSAGAVTERVEAAERSGQILRVRLPVEEDNADEPWKSSASRHRKVRRSDLPMPPTVKVVFADQVYIDRTELPPPMITQLIRLAAFQNPEFYRAQAMRLPTFGKPRIISCAELHAQHVQHVALPRGCFDDVVTCLTDHGFCLSPQCRQGPTASLPTIRRKCQWPVRFQSSVERTGCCDWCCYVCPLLCEGRGIAFPGCVGYHALTFEMFDRVRVCQE